MKKAMQALNDRWLRLIGVPVFAMIANLFFYSDQWISGHFNFWVCYASSMVHTAFYWYANRWVLVVLRDKYPTLKETGQRVIRQILFSTVLSIATSFLFTACYDYFRIWGKDLIWPDYVYNTIVVLFFVYIAAGIYEILFYFSKWQESVKEAEQLKKANLQTQLDSLKSQVSPHFLFNSLNTLSSLIEDDQKKAVQFVNELSRVYRYLLQSNEKALITVQEELTFIEAYFFLLKTRFDQGISMEVEVADVLLQKMLPPLTLQLLVENAVKHNVIAAGKPLQIRIHSADQHWLTVTNNFQKKTVNVASNGLGLSNISAKFRLLNQPGLKVYQDEHHFSVSVPLIQA